MPYQQPLVGHIYNTYSASSSVFFSLSSCFCIYIISNLTWIGSNSRKPINPYKIPFNAIEMEILNPVKRSVPSPIGWIAIKLIQLSRNPIPKNVIFASFIADFAWNNCFIDTDFFFPKIIRKESKKGEDSFYGSDPRRGGDDTRQRLAERGQSKTLQERKRQIAVFSPKRIAEHDPGDDIPGSEL